MVEEDGVGGGSHKKEKERVREGDHVIYSEEFSQCKIFTSAKYAQDQECGVLNPGKSQK